MGTKKAKILLVDDDPDFVSATKLILESRYKVVVASEGEEGVRKARDEKPDLIILDVIMPVEDGFTAAEQLKKDPQLSKIPIIMLTSYSQQKQKGKTSIPVSRGMTLEAEDYVDKPVKPEELFKRVEALLSKG
jgi:CheY-like chemotaxis protein